MHPDRANAPANPLALGAAAGHARRRRPNWTPYAFITPALIIVAAISLYPIGYEIYLSFTDWYLLKNPDPVFTGLDGYRRLFSDSRAGESLIRTVWWTIGTVGLEYVIALPLALLLNRRFWLNGVLTGLILLPWVTPSIVVAYTWRWLLDSNYGIVHALLEAVNIVGDRSVLSDQDRALPAVIVMSAWKGAPFMAVALLATLKSIPDELYEAASIDGAGLVRQFRDITLPMLRGVTVVTSLVLGILAFYSFDIIWVLTKGGPASATELIGVYLFRSFFERLEFSYAATMGVSMLLLLVVFAGVYMRLLGKRAADR
jgi:multiple sugar transport system permease protein